MAFLISAHIVRDEPDATRLGELPSSIGWRVYHHQSANVYIIDTFRAARPAEYPFQTRLPAADIPLELPSDLSALEAFYGFLQKHGLADSFKTSYINFGLLLNRVLGMPVLSLISDDDQMDFAATACDGMLARLKCRCGDLIVTHDAGETQIQPLIPEFEEDEEFLTNLEELRVAVRGATVADRNRPWDSRLHGIAMDEWKRFANTDALILGLGSFDPPDDERDWRLLGES